MKRWSSVLLAGLALAAGAVAFHFYAENQDLRARLAALSAPAAEQTEASSRATTLRAPVNPAAARAEPSFAAADVPPPAPPLEDRGDDGNDRFSDRRARGLEMMSRFLTDPAARAATLTRMKSQVDRMYGDLFVRLGLDELQVETLRTLLAERQMAQTEGGFLMRSAESDQARAEAGAWREAKFAELDSGVNAILGENGTQLLQDYRESAPQRSAVEEINRRASYSGASLDASTSDRLVQVMRSAQAQYPVEVSQWRGSDRNRTPISEEYVSSVLAQQNVQNQAVLTQAREFLSQSQLEALADKQIEDYEALQQQLNFQLRNPDLVGGRGGFGGFRGGTPVAPPEG